MKSFKRPHPSVNTGSMADIAFLLLIFFLVTTTISVDKGINRQLPQPCLDKANCQTFLEERNTLNIILNANNALMVNNELTNIDELKSIIVNFLDNNGGNQCNYCSVFQDLKLSVHPKKAFIGLKSDRLSSFEYFIAVQDEISEAYLELRSIYAQNTFNKPLNALTNKEIKLMQDAYPFNLIEINEKK